MAIKLSDGAYLKNQDGTLQTVEYIDELLQNAVLKIRAKRGKFYPDKNYGSRIDVNLGDSWLLAYARQAVADIDGVCIKSAKKENSYINFCVEINDKERQVSIAFD